MPYITLEAILSKLNEVKASRVLLTFHSMGDTDAVSSAIAISRILPNSVISTPDSITPATVRVLNKLGFDASQIKNTFPEDAKTVILLDVNNFEGCGNFRPYLERFTGEILVIDHHRAIEDKQNMRIFDNEGYNSAASIVYDLLKKFNYNIEPKLAKLIAMGLISDSAEFKNATPKTFLQLGELFETGKTDYITLIEETEHLSPAADRERTIRDLFGAETFVHNGILFIYGTAHAYANLAAESAIKVGADVVLFTATNKDEVTFSARLRPTLDKRYKIHLGAIMKDLSPIIAGTGGGHPCAAGAYGKGINRREAFENAFIEEIKKKIKQ